MDQSEFTITCAQEVFSDFCLCNCNPKCNPNLGLSTRTASAGLLLRHSRQRPLSVFFSGLSLFLLITIVVLRSLSGDLKLQNPKTIPSRRRKPLLSISLKRSSKSNLTRLMNENGNEERPKWGSRQAMYLRIGPYTVMQMILYLEPVHTSWMNDSVLERLLFALKERIPTKLRSDREASKKGSKANRDRSRVDVFRGSDYQIAYFFRSTSQKHVVLLKDKNLIFSSPNEDQAPMQSSSSSPEPLHAEATTLSSTSTRKRSRATGLHPGAAKSSHRRLRSVRSASAEVIDENGDTVQGEGQFVPSLDVVIKAEENDDDDPLIIPESSPFVSHPSNEDDDDENGSRLGEPFQEEETNQRLNSEDLDTRKAQVQDTKPKLKVHYRGVEPYPPLPRENEPFERGTFVPGELNRRSESVTPQPELIFRRPSVSRSSLTPAPRIRGDPTQSLFRMESTPAESVAGGIPEDEDEDGMGGLRASSQALANDWGSDEEEEDDEEGGEDLPIPKQA